MGLKIISFFLFVLIFSVCLALPLNKFFVVKEEPYVPSPVSLEFRETYIANNYDVVNNVDGSISFVKKVR